LASAVGYTTCYFGSGYSAWLMAITYYGMNLLFKFNYCLLFVLFYLHFFIIFGRILGLN